MCDNVVILVMRRNSRVLGSSQDVCRGHLRCGTLSLLTHIFRLFESFFLPVEQCNEMTEQENKQIIVPSFRASFLLSAISYEDLTREYHVAVESGTFTGASSLELAKWFDKVYTVEVNEALYQRAKTKFAKNTKITCLHGDSAAVIPTINIDEPALFYLDAHWSGNKNIDWAQSDWKGYHLDTGFRELSQEEQQTFPTSQEQLPLEDELTWIFTTFKHKSIILIDDMDKFDEKGQGTKHLKFVGEDWSHFNIETFLEQWRTSRIERTYRNKNQLLLFLKPIPLEQESQ